MNSAYAFKDTQSKNDEKHGKGSRGLQVVKVNFEQTGSYRLLSTHQSKDDLVDFCDSTLGPLIEYDLNKGSQLEKTLAAYFEYQGNIKKMATTLYIHYNTTLNRLKRIQEITGMNLDSEDDRYCLHSALKIKKHFL